MKIKEYRIVLPMSVDECSFSKEVRQALEMTTQSTTSLYSEYQVGQLYAVAEVSKSETGGGEGVEVITNEPYENDDGEKGQYTHKIYHLKSKVPKFIRLLAPKGSLEIHEKAWNAYPYCRTILTNDYMQDFMIKIETWHKEDMGELENVHELDVETRELAGVTDINIADMNCIKQCDYKPEYDPASVKSCRGPLGPDWKEELANNPTCPHMCAYKLVTVEFKWWGLQTRVEKIIHEMEERLFATFHRQLFCSIDKWINLSMDDIRCIEEKTKEELDALRTSQGVKGMQVEY